MFVLKDLFATDHKPQDVQHTKVRELMKVEPFVYVLGTTLEIPEQKFLQPKKLLKWRGQNASKEKMQS